MVINLMSSTKIQSIIDNLQEGLEVEAKNWLNGLISPDDQAKLAKEIIALANHGGGYVFIGFADANGELTPIAPTADESKVFTQDQIANLVERYVSPPCQCVVEYYKQKSGTISHPVIVVPGNHRVPIWAKRGAPDTNILRNDRVYIRRPGGKSEEARTQDDWERLLDRLVKSRQNTLIDAIREAINPTQDLLPAASDPGIESWERDGLLAWQEQLSGLDTNDPRRLLHGYWTISFSISGFSATLTDLNDALRKEMPKYSGWPPFTYLEREPIRPRGRGDKIVAWMGAIDPERDESHEYRAEHADFWQMSRDGKGFMLRPMQEDRPGFLANMRPRPTPPYFDWVIPIYRMAEVLKFIEALGLRFADGNAEFTLRISYFKAKGRSLQQQSFKYNLWDGATTHEDLLVSTITAKVAEVALNIEELVFRLLAPIYEQFDFTKLPKNLVDNVCRDALKP